MIALLSKIFVKEHFDDTQKRKAYGTLCSVVGICLNIVLFIFKFIAGTISGSVAITADAFNNLSDAGSSFISLVGFWFAGKKPDTDHPFGHGRFEYIAGLLVAIAIILMGFELGKSSIEKIIHPEPIDTSILVMVILVVAIFVKGYMFFYNRSVGKKIGSTTLQATATDSLNDMLATAVVLISTIVAATTGVNIDAYAGIVVTIFILLAGYSAVKDTISPLLGTPPEPEFVKEIETIVLSHKYAVGIHDMMVHDYGPGRVIISLHVEVPGNENVFDLHDEIDLMERDLREQLGCLATIHMDPIETDNELVNEMKDKVKAIVENVDERLRIHDFRMVQGPTHTNVIFDVEVPYEIKMEDDEIKKVIFTKVYELNNNCFCVIDIDRLFV